MEGQRSFCLAKSGSSTDPTHRSIQTRVTDQFRGEILSISGGADFYGSSPEELRREFKRSLDVFLEVCKEKGIKPRRQYSGKFNLRIPPELHEKLAMTAEAQGKSLNSLAQEALQRSVSA